MYVCTPTFTINTEQEDVVVVVVTKLE